MCLDIIIAIGFRINYRICSFVTSLIDHLFLMTYKANDRTLKLYKHIILILRSSISRRRCTFLALWIRDFNKVLWFEWFLFVPVLKS